MYACLSGQLDITLAGGQGRFPTILSLTHAVRFLFYGRPMEQGRPLYFYRVVSIFFFFFLLFSSPDLSGRRVDVYDTSTHGVALVQI